MHVQILEYERRQMYADPAHAYKEYFIKYVEAYLFSPWINAA